MTIDLRVATCQTLPEVDVDEAPLAEALARAGVRAHLLAWDDPQVDWDARIPTVIRSTWNYALDLPAFLAWLDRVERAAPVWNPPAIVRANVRKRYLLELAARGVPVVPTQLVDSKPFAFAAEGKVVVKPEVGAGSLGARVFDLARGRDAAVAHMDELFGRGAFLVQPYMESVHAYGERSLVWIDGALSHEIRKSPRFSGDEENIEGPFPIADDERAVAEAALAPYARDLLYARVDLVRDDANQPRVMELELVEPSLFFARQPGSADRFVAGLLRRLG